MYLSPLRGSYGTIKERGASHYLMTDRMERRRRDIYLAWGVSPRIPEPSYGQP